MLSRCTPRERDRADLEPQRADGVILDEAGVEEPGIEAAAEEVERPLVPRQTVPQPTPRCRRQLWHLTDLAREWLVGTSFRPEGLRRLAERGIGRERGARCILHGSDTDVLYCVLRDLARRNALSETVQDALQARHALTVRRWHALRGVEALRAAWTTQLTVPLIEPAEPAADSAAFWALCTHPDGADLEAGALADLRQRSYARLQLLVSLQQRLAQHEASDRDRRQQVESLQQRCQTLQREHDAEQQRHRQLEAEWRGAIEGLRQREVFAAAREQFVAPSSAPATETPRTLLPSVTPAVRKATPRHVGDVAAAPAAPSNPHTDRPTSPDEPPGPAITPGRRVLCVGGMAGSRHRYRTLIERAGARFEYHDGGLEDAASRLDQQLIAADLVVCHAGCVNHEAYRRIKGHCQRTAKPCVYLERPSIACFARRLDLDTRPAPTRPAAASTTP
jgi:hypothetical protein